MARKRKNNNPTLSRTKRLIGIVCALLVLCAALLDTRGSAFFSLNAGAEETPKLAHYVNQKDEAVNGNVHIDLETGKETFSFDIQAYIPADAVKLVITEPLSPVFSFVNADTVYRCQFQEASEWGKNPALSGESFMVPECRPVLTIDRSDSVREVLTAELDLSGLSDDVKAQVRGKWLHLGFDVRISDGHSYDEGMLNYVFSTYKDAPPVPVNEPVYDAPPGPHNGLKAQASYIVETEAGAEEPVYSNIVTVARTEQAAPAYDAAQTESADAADRTAPAEADDNAGSRQEAQTRSVTLQKNNSSGDATDDTTGDITDTDGNVSESAANGTTKDKTENDASGTETRPKADDTQDDAADASSTEEDEDTATTLDSQNETVKEQSAFSLEGIISFYDVPADRKPESVTITVYADGEERVSFELNGGRVAKVVSGTLGPGCTVDPAAVGEAWGFSITNLEEQTADGKKITYTIKETVRPDGYTVTYAGGGEYADADNSFTILNMYSEEQELEDARINGTKDKKEKEEEKEDKDTVLEDGTIELYVNGGAKDISLAQRDELFYYTIEAVVPAGAKTFTIKDTLDPVLKMYSEADEITVTADGATVPSEGDVRGKLQKTVVLDGQALTVRIPEAEQYEGKKISVRFDAVIRSDMDVSAYASKNGEIPNSAKAEATDGKTQVTTQQSATRYVKMPDEPGVKKTVNDTENYVMETADDTLNYTITARIPLDAVTYTLVDTVSQVIEVKSVSAEIDGKTVASSALTARGQEVSMKINDAYNFTGETVTMHVNARIVEGADLSLFNNYQVPNTVSIFVNGRLYETSAPATVDGNVLGVRRSRVRGGRTGEKRLIVDIVVGAAALVTLIVLLRKRVEF